ncbi:MAG TPA: LCP family protein [Acidimicrobiales bacterium]|nr:LCP family protein [Acidimicrobiales bacterium]
MSDLRIAATRAGHHNGDGNEGNGSMSATEGGRRLADAPPEVARRVRRRTVVTPAVVPPAPPAPMAKPPRSPTPAPAPAAPRASVSRERAMVLRQRRRRRRLLIAFTGFTAFCTFFVGLGYAYVQRKLGQITRLELPALAEDSGPVMNVLLVGSDSRANLGAADAKGFGQDVVGGQRSDTIMLLHIDPAEQRAAIVSVPRDLYVPIANTNFSDRVNAAFALGGPDQLVATVQRTLGVTIHHYVQVDFSGFKDIVDTVGGVTMYVPYPVRDSGSGLDLGRAGCFELDGNKGLSWVRSRNMEFLIHGTWQADGRGDLGRIERQQDFIRRMMKKALSSGISNPLQLNRLIGVGVRDVSFDSALSTKDLTALGRRFSSLDPDKVVLRTLPTDPADIDGKSVLKLQTAQAQPMIDLLNGKAPLDSTATTVAGPAPVTTAPPSGPRPAEVKVRVLNGVGTAGLAAKTATSLTGAGYVVADKGDAPALAPKTTITYGTGQLAKAQLVQSTLLGPAIVREDATLKTVDINLLLGADFTGLKPGVGAAAPTTVAPTTTAVPEISPVPLPKGTTVPPC